MRPVLYCDADMDRRRREQEEGGGEQEDGGGWTQLDKTAKSIVSEIFFEKCLTSA